MTYELETLANLVKMYLEESSPILSGNMYREIALAELVEVKDNEITFCINAPFYDMKKWRKTGVIVHTGKKYGSISDYAMWVNELGAFGTHNASEHWVNRALYEAALMVPDARVICELEL